MRETFLNIKNQLFGRSKSSAPTTSDSSLGEDYLEVSHEGGMEGKDKFKVQQFVIQDFEDIKGILDALRFGNTIGLVNMKPLKDKDIVELKRAVGKIKKTCDALGGDIAGFGEDYLVVTPQFAYIYRGAPEPVKQQPSADFNSDLDL